MGFDGPDQLARPKIDTDALHPARPEARRSRPFQTASHSLARPRRLSRLTD